MTNFQYLQFFCRTFVFFALLLWQGTVIAQGSWQSELVYVGGDDRLVYESDAQGNRIPDFSYAGYKNSEEPIPNLPVVKTISALAGDNTAHIQSAIDEVSRRPPDADGFRGALLLTAGEYEIKLQLRIQADGVVLRGAGDGDDPAANTILRATGNIPGRRTVIIAGGGSSSQWRDEVHGTRQNITSDSVLVGDRSFEVENGSQYMVGDNIIIIHPCTEAWLEAIDYGGTFSDLPGAEPGVDVPWEIDSQPIVYNRYVTDIRGNTITIDAPVFNHLIRNLSQSYIYRYARQGLNTHIGIENLRIDIETAGGSDEFHAWNAIDLYQIEDAWVRNCTMLHFGLSGIRTNTATRITIENCKALDPVSIIEGGKRYNFQVYTASQQILFKNCHATNGRHHYMSNGTSWTSGIVFLDCTSSGAYAGSEGHRRWSQGLLYDNHIELDGPRGGVNPRLLGLYNRGYFGTSHGWSAAHSLAWACDVKGGELHVQKPPSAQNYAIGCFGSITGTRPPCSFDVPEGYIEGSNQDGLTPRSLFLAQLSERLNGVVDVQPKPLGSENLPQDFVLYQNYPNPFNPTTVLKYQLSKSAEVTLQIFDVTGALVETPVNARQHPGTYMVTWQAVRVAAGVYVYRLKVNERILTRKMVLLK